MQDNSKRIKELLAIANKAKNHDDAEKTISHDAFSTSISQSAESVAQSSNKRNTGNYKKSGISKLSRFFLKLIFATVVLYGTFMILYFKVQRSDIIAFALYISIAAIIGLLMSYNAEKYRITTFIFSFFASSLLCFVLIIFIYG